MAISVNTCITNMNKDRKYEKILEGMANNPVIEEEKKETSDSKKTLT